MHTSSLCYLLSFPPLSTIIEEQTTLINPLLDSFFFLRYIQQPGSGRPVKSLAGHFPIFAPLHSVTLLVAARNRGVFRYLLESSSLSFRSHRLFVSKALYSVCLYVMMGKFSAIPGYLVLLVGSLLAYFIAGRIAVWRRLRSFRGPFLTNFTNWPHRKALLQQRGHEYYGEVCEKYGSILNSPPFAPAEDKPHSSCRIVNLLIAHHYMINDRPNSTDRTKHLGHLVPRSVGSCKQLPWVSTL